MPPAKSVLPIFSRYLIISDELSFTTVVTPLKVILKLSPSLLALIPNSFNLSISPVEASATASIICFKLLPIALAVLPNEVNAASVGDNPKAFILINASVISLTEYGVFDANCCIPSNAICAFLALPVTVSSETRKDCISLFTSKMLFEN